MRIVQTKGHSKLELEDERVFTFNGDVSVSQDEIAFNFENTKGKVLKQYKKRRTIITILEDA